MANDEISRITSQEMEKVKSEIQTTVKNYVNNIGQAMKVALPSATTMTEEAKKQAGIQVASMGSVKEQIKQLEKIRSSQAAPSNLDRMSANEKIRVVDIENQYNKAWEKAHPNDKSKNKAVTYSYADYNRSTGTFDDAKYFYVELDDWNETVDLWYDFLTNFSGTADDADDGESRKNIAKEMGFVDSNGKALSKSEIGKISKQDFSKFLDKMFADMGRKDILNPFTKQSTKGMADIQRIRPDQMWNNLKKSTTFVYNDTHDQYVIGNMAGKTKEEIQKLAVHDIKKFTWDKKANARLSRTAQYMGGMNAEILEAFFGAFNEQAHNAKSDVQSEGQLLVTLDKSVDDAIDVLNNLADKAIVDFTKENGYSPINASGGISKEHTAWFQGYMAKNADMIRGQLDNILTDNFSGGLAATASPTAASDYHTSGFNEFKGGLSKSAQEYFTSKGLGKRLEVEIKGIKAGEGDSRVGTSADRELADLFSWASHNGFVILYEKTGAGDKEEYEFYVVPQELYDENNVEETKANSYNFSWIAPDAKGRLKSGNIGSTTQFFYDLDTGKYMDVNTWGLSKNISAIKNYAGKKKGDDGYKTIKEVNNLLKAQAMSTRQSAPSRWNGTKDYDTINWDNREVDIDESQITQEELRRSNALMSWSAALSKYFERNIGARQQAASWIGEKDFNSWEVPEAIQNVLHRYLIEKTYNAEHYRESIENGNDQLLKEFISSPEFQGLLDRIDEYFAEGGGYYVHSLSHGSVGVGKAFANIEADLPFTDMLAMQSTASENTSKGKANSVNRKVLSYEKLLKSGIWHKSSLREDDKNGAVLTTDTMSLPKEILQAAVRKQWKGSKYIEGVTEERLFGDSKFANSAKFYSNSKTDTVGYNDKGEISVKKGFQSYLTKLDEQITNVNDLALNQTKYFNQNFDKATDRDLKLTNGLTIPKGSYVTKVTRTEKGLEVSYVTASALRQAQKFVDTGTNQRHEFGYLRQENVIEAIQESNLPEDEKSLLISKIQGDGKNDKGIHSFVMDTPSSRASSARVNGTFNEGYWEYLVNQIKTEEQFNQIASEVGGFGARYKWQKGKGVVSNLTLNGGDVSTLANQKYFKDNKLWEQIDPKLREVILQTHEGISEDEINKLLPQYRATYSSNMSDVSFYKNDTSDEKVTLNSMYSDAWDVAERLGIVEKGLKGRIKTIAPSATTVAEYSDMAGLGYIDNGESRVRVSTRMKENLRGRLEHLVASGVATQEQADKYLEEYNQINRGSDRAINKYNHTLAAMKGNEENGGRLSDTKMFNAVFGNGQGKLKTGGQLDTNDIDISQADFNDLQRIDGTNTISEEDYKKSVISLLYSSVEAAGYTLGDNAQVQLSFKGLDKDTIAALNAVGFYDGQILALTPEEVTEINSQGIGVKQVSDQSSETLTHLRNALNVASGKDLESSFEKHITNEETGTKKADAYYQQLQKERVRTGGDYYKEAVSDKIIATANLKVVGLDTTKDEDDLTKVVTELEEKKRLLAHTKDEAIKKQLEQEIKSLDEQRKDLEEKVANNEETAYGVISYQGAKELLSLGNLPKNESIDTVFASVLADIHSRYEDFNDESIESLKDFNLKDFDKLGIEEKKKTYTDLINKYVEALSQSNMALPAWVLRNPLINESNLLAGLKINTNTEDLSGEYTGQATNVLMLPQIVADLLNADFDGDMIQVCASLIKDNTEIGNKLFKNILKNSLNTRKALIAQGNWVDKGQSPEEFAEELIKQAKVMTDAEFNSKFTTSTLQGQEGLGLSSYLNTGTQANLRAYRHINKDNGKQAVADEIFRTISSEMVEQKGISAKKTLEKIVESDTGNWDIDTLNRLKDAVFNYTGTDEQKKLLDEYKIKDDNEKLQYIIQSVIDAYGEETALQSGVLVKKKNEETGKEYYGLSDNALMQMVTHAKLVNDEAAGKVEGLKSKDNRYLKLQYNNAKRADFNKINPELADSPNTSTVSRYWKDYNAEGKSVNELNGEYGDHAEAVDKAAQAEQAKLAASEKLTKALTKESDAVAEVKENVEDLTKSEEKALKTKKEFETGFFEYAEGGYKGITQTEEGRSFRVGDKEYNQNSYDRVTELIDLNPDSDLNDENLPKWQRDMLKKTSIRGTYGHTLMEMIAKSGSGSVEEAMKSGAQFSEPLETAEKEMRSALGVGATETLVDQYKKRADNLAKVAKLEGLLPEEGAINSNNVEHTFAGKFKNETKGISGQADIFNDEKYLMGDWKFSSAHDESTVMKRILQLSAYAAFHEEEIIQQIDEEQKALESADNDEDKAKIQARIDELNSQLTNWEQKGQAKILVSDLDKDGNEFVEVVTSDLVEREKILKFLEENQDLKKLLELKARYEASLKNQPNNKETQAKLLEVEKQIDDYLVDNSDAAKLAKNAQRTIYNSEGKEVKGFENGDDYKKHNAAAAKRDISAYINNYKAQLKVQEDIQKQEQFVATTTGTERENHERILSAQRNKLSLLQSQALVYDEQSKTLNGITLTEEQNKKILDSIALADKQHLINQQMITAQAKQQQGFFQKLVGGFKNQITMFIDTSLAYQAIGRVRSSIRELIQLTEQLDEQLVNIQIATGYSRSEVHDLLIDYNDMASELGRTTSDIATAANDWLRAGYEGEEAAELTKASMMLSTLGQIESADATTYLISTLKGWRLEAEDVIGVVSKLTAVDMSAAISAGDLALAMSRANNSARLAGVDMNQFIGYITTVADVSQKSAESVGESFKTIFSRFGNVKAGKFTATDLEQSSEDFDEGDYENLNDIETVLSKVNIKIRENATTWRDVDDVLTDIGEKWENWDKTTQNAVATAVAGTRQRENVITLFENWDDVAKYAEIAENSYGTATEKMEAYTESVEASKQRLTNAVEAWALLFNGSGIIKSFYDNLTFVVENLHIFGAALLAYATITNVDSIMKTFTSGLTKLAMKLYDLGDMFTITKSKSGGVREIGQNIKTNLQNYANLAEAQAYAETMTQYISVLGEETVIRLNTIQQLGLGLNAENKQQLAKFLETAAIDELTIASYNTLSEETRVALAKALLTNATDAATREVLNGIIANQGLNTTEEQITTLLKEFGLQTQNASGAMRTMAANLRSSALANPGTKAISGAATIVGMMGGGIIGSTLTEDLGGTAQSIGMLLGSTVGQSAANSLVDVVTSIIGGKGILASLTGIGLTGGAALAAAVVAGGVAIYKTAKKNSLKELQEDFKEAQTTLSNIQTSDLIAEEYDKLSAGVDKYGNNVALTDDEYTQFLEDGNKLAELFPELITYTDEQGNNFVGLGDAIGGVTEEIRELIEAQQDLADSELFEEDIYGQSNFSATHTEQIQSQMEDAIEPINYRLKNNGRITTFDTEYLDKNETRDDVLAVIHEMYETGDNELRAEIEEWENKSFNLSDIDINKGFGAELKSRLDNGQRNTAQIIKASSSELDEYKAYLRKISKANSELSETLEDADSEDYAFINGVLKNINNYATNFDPDAILERVSEFGEKLPDILNDLKSKTYKNEDFNLYDIMMGNVDSYDSIEQMDDARQALLDYFAETFGADNMYDETEKAIMFSVGFKVNDDNVIEDTENILTKLRDMGIKEQNDQLVSIANIKELTPEDAKTVTRWLGEGKIDSDTSMDTIVNMLYADRDLPTSLEGMANYVDKRAAVLSKTESTLKSLLVKQGDKLTQGEFSKSGAMVEQYGSYENYTNSIINKIKDNFKNLDINETFSNAPEEVRESLKELKEEVLEGGLTPDDVEEKVNDIVNTEMIAIEGVEGEVASAMIDSFFPEDLEIDGYINTFKELRTAIDSLVDSYNTLTEAQEEQNSKGRLSLNTWTNLLATDENYLKVLEFVKDEETGRVTAVKLADNANQIYAASQLKVVRASAQVAMMDAEVEMAETQKTISQLKDAEDSLTADDDLSEGMVDNSNQVVEGLNLRIRIMNQMGAAFAGVAAGVEAIVNGGNFSDAWAAAKESYSTTLEEINPDYDWKVKYKGNTLEELEDKLIDANDRLKEQQDTYNSWKALLDNTEGIDETNIKDWLEDEELVEDETADLTGEFEALKDVISALNLEYEQMVAYSQGINGVENTADYLSDSYYKVKEQYINKAIAIGEKKLDGATLDDILALYRLGTEEGDDKADELLGYYTDLQDLYIEKANLNDEEIQNRLDMLTVMGDVTDEQIQQLEAKVKTADTEQEELEYTKELNDAVREQIKLKKEVAEYEKKLADYQLEYLKGNTNTTAYKDAIKKSESALKTAVSEAKNLVSTTYQQMYDYYMKLGIYTSSEASALAKESSDYRDAVTEYLEAQQALGDLYMDDFDNKVSMLERRMQELEDSKPNNWATDWDVSTNTVKKGGQTAVTKIKNYYNSLNSYYESIAKEALNTLNKYADELTDEQVQTLTEKYNDAMKSIRDNTVSLHEDIKDYQESVYSALTNEVERYKDQLEEQKEIVEDAYDKEIEKLNDKNTAIERTNKLLELQQNLLNAQDEKERVYKNGIGWVYTTNRSKVKEAESALDDFYLQDSIDDLNNAKDEELNALDERIQNWDDYLKMLQAKYEEYDVLEEQKLLMEELGVTSQEELEAVIKADMLDFTDYMSEHVTDFFTNQIEAMKGFNTAFDEFLAEYKANLEELANINNSGVNTISADSYLGQNDDYLDIPDVQQPKKQVTGDLYDIVLNDKEIASTGSLSNYVDANGYIDYSKAATEAYNKGEISKAVYDLVLREAKIEGSETTDYTQYSSNDDLIKTLEETSTNNTNKTTGAVNDLTTAYSNGQTIANALARENISVTSELGQYAIMMGSNLTTQISDNAAEQLVQTIENTETLSGSIDSTGISVNGVLSDSTSQIVSCLMSIDSNLTTSQATSIVTSSGGGGGSDWNNGNGILDRDYGAEWSAAMASGNTALAEQIHEEKVEAMADAGYDSSHFDSSTGTWSKHDGMESGLIGNVPIDKTKEVIIKALKGEGVFTDEQMNAIANSLEMLEHVSDISQDSVYTGLSSLAGSNLQSAIGTVEDDMLKYMSFKKPSFESAMDINNGDTWTLNGDVVLENCDDPAEFWNQVTQAMSNRFNVNKQRLSK